MNYFKTIKAALDASYGPICRHKNIPVEQAPQAVKTHLNDMNKEWFGFDPADIDYGDPLCRFAYLFAHTAANANLCEIAIRESSDVCKLIEERATANGELKVCAFGGGPGTELLALSKHLWKTRPDGPHVQVSFTLLDRVNEWIESWQALEAEIKANLKAKYGPFPKHPFSVSGYFVSNDMTKPNQYVNLPTLFKQDIFFLNYAVSEIIGGNVKYLDTNRQFLDLITAAVNACPSGSKFVITDRDQDSVIGNSRRLLREAGLQVAEPGKVCRRMDDDERADELKSYSGDIARQPRCWWKGRFDSGSNRGAFYLVGTKP
jgi:hypothetical protein